MVALDLKEELEVLVEALGEEAVPFAICGGIAVTIHGAPRLTNDLDLLVPATSIDAAKQTAARVGFDIPAAPMTFGRGTAQHGPFIGYRSWTRVSSSRSI